MSTSANRSIKLLVAKNPTSKASFSIFVPFHRPISSTLQRMPLRSRPKFSNFSTTASQYTMASSYAVVAGVGAGTGLSVAKKFAESYPVVLFARNPANYEQIVKDINSSGGKAIGISTDVADPASIKKAFSQIEEEFKGAKLAAAVFNVGGGFLRKPFLELTQEQFEGGYKANG
jgi:short chain dehydrogenase